MLKNIIGAVHGGAVFNRRAEILGSRIGELLPPKADVLDVGTGDGTIANIWVKQNPGISVRGVDIMIRPSTNVPVSLFDGTTLPLPDGSVDVVSFVDVLHHASDPQRLLSEAARVSRRWVIIKDHFAESRFDNSVLAFMDWVGNAPHGVVLPYNYWSRQQWNEAFARAGLTIDNLDGRIPLYPQPFNFVFGRGLHFIARLAKAID